jgi:hypothetical protein
LVQLSQPFDVRSHTYERLSRGFMELAWAARLVLYRMRMLTQMHRRRGKSKHAQTMILYRADVGR